MQRHEKAKAIADLMTRHAQATMLSMTALANVSRKKPRIVSKNNTFRSRSLRKRRIGLLTANMSIQQMLASSQLALILATPIPKFPYGGVNNNYNQAIVNESGKETII